MKKFDIDLIDVDADGIAESQTPAAGGVQSLTLDGVLADLGTAGEFDIYDAGYSTGIGGVQIGITSAGNDSGNTFVVTGTDQNGDAATESITGPNAGTVESTGYWRTITSITISANAVGAITVGTVDEAVTVDVMLNKYVTSTVAVSGLAGTINYGIQESFDPQNAVPVNWIDAQASKTADLAAELTAKASYTRLVVNSYSSGAELQFHWQTGYSG